MTFLKLVLRNLLRHPLRSFLTIGSLVVALFLLCTLRSILTMLDAGVESANATRLIVQSAVSLFVDLPQSYQAKMAAVPGVQRISKWHYFGGYYIDERNQFSQFFSDPDTILDMYPEVRIVEGSREAFQANRRGCVVASNLAQRFDWRIGDTLPLTGTIYAHPDGPGVPWEFTVEAVYEPTSPNYADMMFMQWAYFEETMEGGGEPTPPVGTYVIQLESGADATAVMASIDGLFENGPQRVQATSESEFYRQFVTMFGNVPLFVSSIGGAIVVAILLACLNTMLMAAREQTVDVGIMKALGFTDGAMMVLLAGQALALCAVGGGLGVALALATETAVADAVASFWPGYHVAASTVALGLAVTLALGLVSGLAPAWIASRLRCVEALQPS